MDSYYKKQLNLVDTEGLHNPVFKIASVTASTKWMDLNIESAQELVDWLTKNFLSDENSN